ncbi:hypothetical protein M569_06463 [Genlisea aurea]|uniref:Uncharacterized protein n=1 Tax=Genlisea aurea TaxID=192259 RepID=S8E7A7_9LAMI|nr:hypothetical protein M569_06463 [Genlisea aurea]
MASFRFFADGWRKHGAAVLALSLLFSSWARVRVDPDYPRVNPYVTGTGNPYP